MVICTPSYGNASVIRKIDVVVRVHVDNYSLVAVLNPHDESTVRRLLRDFCSYDQSADRSVIKYVDLQYIYPYVYKCKHYPVGHPRCLIGLNL